jgi:CO/xanthine dehydrogenase Mo-binding subunit
MRVYMNKIPKGAFRGFGSSRMHFALELMLDGAAERIQIDPMDLRLKNATQLGDIAIHGWKINSCGLGDSIRQAGEKAGWNVKRKENSRDQGIGMGCLVHVSSKGGIHPQYDGSSAIAMMNEPGNVKLISGEGDFGQGASTVFARLFPNRSEFPCR